MLQGCAGRYASQATSTSSVPERASFENIINLMWTSLERGTRIPVITGKTSLNYTNICRSHLLNRTHYRLYSLSPPPLLAHALPHPAYQQRYDHPATQPPITTVSYAPCHRAAIVPSPPLASLYTHWPSRERDISQTIRGGRQAASRR